MRRLFADAMYWIAIANHKDQWHAKAVHVMRSLGQAMLVTTEEVLDEFLTYYSGHGPVLRNNAAQTVEDALGQFRAPHTRRGQRAPACPKCPCGGGWGGRAVLSLVGR